MRKKIVSKDLDPKVQVRTLGNCVLGVISGYCVLETASRILEMQFHEQVVAIARVRIEPVTVDSDADIPSQRAERNISWRRHILGSDYTATKWRVLDVSKIPAREETFLIMVMRKAADKALSDRAFAKTLVDWRKHYYAVKQSATIHFDDDERDRLEFVPRKTRKLTDPAMRPPDMDDDQRDAEDMELARMAFQ